MSLPGRLDHAAFGYFRLVEFTPIIAVLWLG